MRSSTLSPGHRSWNFEAAALAAFFAAVACGCVERTIDIRTDPPGARVYVDGRFAGQSPVSVPFTHYGTREVSAESGRARRACEIVALYPPLHQVFPLDFLSDCMLPFTIRSSRVVELRMPPQEGGAAAKRAELIAAASELRARASR